MLDTAEQVQSKTRNKQKRTNYVLAGTLIANGVTYEDAAIQCGAKNGESLRRGLFRKGVTARSARAVTPTELKTRTVTMQVVSQASEIIREKFSGILQSQTDKLAEIRPRANLKHIKAIGDAIEPLVRSAKIVHGWSNDTPSNGLQLQIVNNVRIESSDDTSTVSSANPTVDIESSVTDNPT